MRRKPLIFTVTAFVLLLAAAFIYPLVATARDDQAFCTNCHVMEEVGKTHTSSYHKNQVTCSECHTGSLVQKYTDGARHLYHNITGDYPTPITLRDSSKEVVAGQCIECHRALSSHARTKQSQGENCLDCHKGHTSRPYSIRGLAE